MARYQVSCNVADSSQITLSPDGYVTCPVGTMQVIENSPSISSLDFDDMDWLAGQVLVMAFTAYGLGLLIRTAYQLFIPNIVKRG